MASSKKVRLLWIARFDYRGGLQVEEHHHSFYQCVFILRGEAAARISGETVTLKSGQFLWIPPNSPHGWTVPAESFLETLDMKFAFSSANAGTGFPEKPQSMERPDLGPLFSALLATAQAGGEHLENRCALVLQALLWQWQDSRALNLSYPYAESSDPAPSSLVESLRRCFAQAPAKKWTSADIAAAMRYSYRRVSQICDQASGQTPLALLKEERVRQAKELLCFGEIAIKEIADRVGFESVHHFSRIFREATGLPPATWRKREQEKPSASIQVAPGFQNRNRVVGG
ncbi:MAG: helix-turn-helix domain-containing protein [Opitutales bacterium]|nr:helix-turn-helix domain-containing protein [Opitutales bacterium]MCH8540529.1 AraC family transcriptional regulator [Opitutales bacterium]